jgi:hypothetical protein
MQNGIMAKAPSYDTKVSARLPEELHDMFDALLKRGVRAGLKFKDRKLGIEGVVSALILDFFDRPEPEWLIRLGKGLRRVEAMINDEYAPADDASEAADASAPRAPGHWPGGEAQHMTDSLKREIRESGRARPRKPREPDIEIGTPLKGGPKTPHQRKKGAG